MDKEVVYSFESSLTIQLEGEVDELACRAIKRYYKEDERTSNYALPSQVLGILFKSGEPLIVKCVVSVYSDGSLACKLKD